MKDMRKDAYENLRKYPIKGTMKEKGIFSRVILPTRG